MSRQEQEPARDDVTEVAPGVLRCMLPVDLPGLGHVNCYAVEDRRGWAVIDPGLAEVASCTALEARLRQAGADVRHVHTVVVTHSHPDHFGAADWVRHRSGADLVAHTSFSSAWDPGPDGEPELQAADPGTDPGDDAGAPPPWVRTTPWGGTAWAPVDPDRPPAWATTLPVPTRRLADADTVELGGRPWVAIHTPGHTADHLCLFDPSTGTLLSGDHVLPTITPHISGLVPLGSDPLARFFASLDRVAGLDGVTVALPAHGHPFTDVAARADAIRVHHEGRLAALRAASAEAGPATVPELARRLFRSRSWGPLAESETYAHLEHLRLAGEAERRDDAGVPVYAVA